MSGATQRVVLVERKENFERVTPNRPEGCNAFDPAFWLGGVVEDEV